MFFFRSLILLGFFKGYLVFVKIVWVVWLFVVEIMMKFCVVWFNLVIVYCLMIFFWLIRISLLIIFLSLLSKWLEIKKEVFWVVKLVMIFCIFFVVCGFKLFIGLFKIMIDGWFSKVRVIFNFCFIFNE